MAELSTTSPRTGLGLRIPSMVSPIKTTFVPVHLLLVPVFHTLTGKISSKFLAKHRIP